MSAEKQRPPDEEEQGIEAPVVDDAPEEAEGESEMVTAEELRGELGEIGTRFKTAGLKPLRQMMRSYVDNILDSVDGLLSALEGNKRKKGR